MVQVSVHCVVSSYGGGDHIVDLIGRALGDDEVSMRHALDAHDPMRHEVRFTVEEDKAAAALERFLEVVRADGSVIVGEPIVVRED